MSKLYGITYNDYIATLSQLSRELYNGTELNDYMTLDNYKASIIAYSADDESTLPYCEWLENYISYSLLEGIWSCQNYYTLNS